MLDNARYQRNAVVQGLAASLGIALLFLPSYSPNLNLIERLWKFTGSGPCTAGIIRRSPSSGPPSRRCSTALSTTHADQLKTLMTLKFPDL